MVEVDECFVRQYWGWDIKQLRKGEVLVWHSRWRARVEYSVPKDKPSISNIGDRLEARLIG